MRSAKHGMKAFGLAMLTVVGMMVVGTGGAQGQLGQYLVNLGSALLATFQGWQVGGGLLTVKARDLKLECAALSVSEGKINSSTDASGKVEFTGCVSYSLSTGVKLADCQLKTLETITASFLALPSLVSPETYVLFESIPPATVFATISYKSGTACTLPLNNPVTGSVVMRIPFLDLYAQTGEFHPKNQELTGDKLSFGGFTAFLQGSVWTELLGTHFGQKIGIH
jgi:hypothetical protein